MGRLKDEKEGERGSNGGREDYGKERLEDGTMERKGDGLREDRRG